MSKSGPSAKAKSSEPNTSKGFNQFGKAMNKAGDTVGKMK